MKLDPNELSGDEIQTFAGVLLDADYFQDKAHVISYFEKPYHFEEEFELWNKMGRPTKDNTKRFRKFAKRLFEL